MYLYSVPVYLYLKYLQSQAPYGLCKHLLEHTNNDYVLFEASGLLKDGLIR